MRVQMEILGATGTTSESTAEKASSLSFYHVEGDVFPTFWHFHPELELTFIFQGYGIRMIGDYVRSFTEYDLVLTGPNLVHGWESDAECAGPCRAAGLHFREELIPDFPEFAHLGKMLAESRKGLWFPQEDDRVGQEILRLESLSPSRRVLGFLNLLLDLAENHERHSLSHTTFVRSNAGREQQNRLLKATSYILDNCKGPLKLGDVAAHLSVSPNYFSRWFKKSVGQSFIDYVNSARVEHACQLLLKTDLQIGEIAYQSGFESTSSFNRHFKARKGVSPRQLRRSPSERD